MMAAAGSAENVCLRSLSEARQSTCVAVDTATWESIKKFGEYRPDTQTMVVTYDGKDVLQIFTGLPRLESGVLVFTQDTLEVVGFMANFGGHHDCVIVPRNSNSS